MLLSSEAREDLLVIFSSGTNSLLSRESIYNKSMLNIAINSFRELIRNRILLVILFFASLLILFSLVLSSLSLGQTNRIILDFGLSMVEISGLIATLLI